jgi:hypothetical protein
MQYFRGCHVERDAVQTEIQGAMFATRSEMSPMQVLVKCVIFEGRKAQAADAERAPRIARVREGQVLGAWRAVDGRIGFALLDISSMAMVSGLLYDSFPGARHIDVDEVIAVEAVADSTQPMQSPATGKARQTGT